ncbi:hypothetical protein ACGFMM_24810 [Streptomyces sp. NPDC048604]|uniref:hypothetical protein n=1 Tax=Streptomyces sp. NPDC048604 TaxID=3365578 RepID=UPI003713DDD0
MRRLADALGIDDLAALSGDERLSAASYTKAAHPSLLRVKEALTDYRLAGRDEEPQAADALSARGRLACQLWHGFGDHRSRDAGERHEARVDLAMRAAELLDAERGPQDIARIGLLHLAAALSYAKVGQRGNAERHWDRAEKEARRLGDGYSHPWLIFGRGMVDAYAITMNADLIRAGAAVDVAASVDLGPMPSSTRRSFHIIETARAYILQGENVAVIHLLRRGTRPRPRPRDTTSSPGRPPWSSRSAAGRSSATTPAVWPANSASPPEGYESYPSGRGQRLYPLPPPVAPTVGESNRSRRPPSRRPPGGRPRRASWRRSSSSATGRAAG